MGAIYRGLVLIACFAGTHLAGEEISWKSLVDEVVSENPDLVKAKLELEQSTKRIEIAKSSYYPKISLSWMDQDQTQNHKEMLKTTGMTSKGSVQWNLFNGFQDTNRVEQKTEDSRLAEFQVYSRIKSLNNQVILLVANIVRLQFDKANLEEKLSIEKEKQSEVDLSVKARTAKSIDLLNIKASILSTKSDLEQTSIDLNSAWLSLSKLTLKPILPRKVTVDLESLSDIPSQFEVEEHPDIKIAIQSKKASEKSISVLRGQYSPSLDLSYNQYFFRPEAQKDIKWDLQLSLSYQIPIDSRVSSQVEEALLLAKSKEIDLLAISNQYKKEFARLSLEHTEGIKRLKSNINQTVNTYKEITSTYKKESRDGLVSINAFLDSTANLLQAKRSRDSLIVELYTKKLQLENISLN